MACVRAAWLTVSEASLRSWTCVACVLGPASAVRLRLGLPRRPAVAVCRTGLLILWIPPFSDHCRAGGRGPVSLLVGGAACEGCTTRNGPQGAED